MKLGLITQPNRLWVRILHDKYKSLKPTIPMVYKPSSSSSTWNSMSKVWDRFMAHVGWEVGKGDQISFWYSKWSLLPEPLVKYAFSTAEHILHARVSNLRNPTRGWNFSLLNRHLHPEVIRQIALVQPPNPSGDDDVLVWRPSSDGNFSIKSAYKAMVSQKDQANDSIWFKIWKWPAYEKIKYFLWKAAWDRLLFNSNYIEGNAHSQCICTFGCNIPDSSIHILRDCIEARSI